MGPGRARFGPLVENGVIAAPGRPRADDSRQDRLLSSLGRSSWVADP